MVVSLLSFRVLAGFFFSPGAMTGIMNQIRSVCRFGSKLVARLTAPPDERLGLNLSTALAAGMAPPSEDEPFDPREATARREVLIRALWALSPLVLGCPVARSEVSISGLLEAIFQVSPLTTCSRLGVFHDYGCYVPWTFRPVIRTVGFR